MHNPFIHHSLRKLYNLLKSARPHEVNKKMDRASTKSQHIMNLSLYTLKHDLVLEPQCPLENFYLIDELQYMSFGSIRSLSSML